MCLHITYLLDGESASSGRAAAGQERTIWSGVTTRGARGQSGFSAKKVRISSKQYRIDNFLSRRPECLNKKVKTYSG